MDEAQPDGVGREETLEDVAAPGPYGRLAALLDHPLWPWAAGEAPRLGHWLNFPPAARRSELGEDGHPRRGGFLPAIALPRRMWAESEVSFLAPVPLGAPLVRRSRVAAVEPKRGRSGAMVFVGVEHAIFADGRLARRERQTLVYREAGGAPPPPAAPAEGGELLGRVEPDEVMLFRYSALTYNAHRIHYDAPYAREVEGYPGLVVHGPLMATLLLDALERRRPGTPVARFAFRAERPLFCGERLDLVLAGEAEGRLRLEARGPDGARRVSAEVAVGGT